MTACARPDCTGTVDETGFCDYCGHAPAAAAVGVASSTTTGAVSTASGRRSRVGDPLSLPVFDFPDPSSRILQDPRVPDRVRRCANPECSNLVALPSLGSGFCLVCGTAFSFLPSLEPDDVVGDQYRVVGCIARGGLGWIYLALDTRLDDNPVVLKGLIDVGDADLATAERQALTTIDHPNIVRIFNFVMHPDARTGVPRAYIVMEYVDGLVLSEVAEQSRHGLLPLGEPLRTEHVITCGLQLLSAFEYLHERELLYCDLKPENVIIRSGRYGERGNRIKLIDLGAVRRIGDRTSKTVITHGFQVSTEEVERRGLTVDSDLHTLGETLHRLYLATSDRTGQHDPAGQRRVEVGIESFRRVCARAKHADPARRFPSAADMAEQLRGVLREIASLRDGRARPDRSTLFTHTATLLDAGLGAVPPLRRWIDRVTGVPLTDVDLDDGRPAPGAVAVGLPVPVVSPEDKAADFLTAAAADDAHRLLDKLEKADPQTVEVSLARCRVALVLADRTTAAESLARARDLVEDGADWRLRWHDGLLALAAENLAAAKAAFDDVYAVLPGEEAPKLALAFCAEHDGDHTRAEALYDAVWRRDRTVVSAAFGLARVRLARGDRAGAVALLEETPAESRHHDAARIATVRVLSGILDGGDRPSADDLRAAERGLAELYLDGGASTGESRTRLEAVVQEAALGVRLADGGGADEADLRLRLERSYRALARQADTRAYRSDLVDLANRFRPVTFR
ncbi:tetratricopeptide repeat protein [Umezawaea sp. Da 62-37]|uniref:serine/threonine-protein kinase n=1 Tax=Umezawaea sp. Da 62-37 TaxID=3075927 RepID=UPI0028F6F27E|nr:tetratricopeptide repeat protein [Umezawaea sp. Da 62-37]WNV86113.1 tetratricopeptide repeat protein [Umezawaea sp. Da 62-37]